MCIFIKYPSILGTTLALVVLLSGVPLFADTEVPPDIFADAVWSKAGSPYLIKQSVILHTGVTLTIEPGVTVKFYESSLRLDGRLLVQGTEAEKITFTTSDPAKHWGFIHFTDQSVDAEFDPDGNYHSGSILEQCIIEYGGGANVDNNGALRLEAAHPYVTKCTIRFSQSWGLNAWNLNASLKIRHCLVHDNTGGGLSAQSSTGSPYVADNTVQANQSGGGIRVSGTEPVITRNIIVWNTSIGNYVGGGISADNNTEISSNIIRHNETANSGGGINGGGKILKNVVDQNSALYGGGIHTQASEVKENIITRNRAQFSGGGLSIVTNGSVLVTNNILASNTAQTGGACYTYSNRLWGDAHLTFLNASHNAINGNVANTSSALYSDNYAITYNTITNNRATDTDGNTIGLANYEANSSQVINYNNIFHNNSAWEIRNYAPNGSPDVAAEHNWWGTADYNAISAKIYDFTNNQNIGSVNFYPWQSAILFWKNPTDSSPDDPPISLPQGLRIQRQGKKVMLTWLPNAEGDVAGYRVYWGTDPDYHFSNQVDVGKNITYILDNLLENKYYFAVTAYDQNYNPNLDNQQTPVNENQTQGNESWFADKSYEVKGFYCLPGLNLLLLN